LKDRAHAGVVDDRGVEPSVAGVVRRGAAQARRLSELGVANNCQQVLTRVLVGPARLSLPKRLPLSRIRESGAPLERQLKPHAERLPTEGRTPSFVAVDGHAAGLVAVADRPAAGAREAIAALRALGLDVVMVSGDRSATARAVAAELGIDRVFAEVKPEGKARVVAEERARGRVVAMVGDGVNDAPALAGADVGIAIGSGTDIAIAAADVALLRSGVTALPAVFGLGRAALRTIRQNLFWAFVYNVVGIPIAAGLLYPLTGWLLSPVLASAAMSLSSVSVLSNSLRLRRFR
jgi:P-type Cu+ transporter